MRRITFDRFGDPTEVLQISEAPTPSPGPAEVLVRMRVRPVNPSDLLTIRGFYGTLPTLPATPGYEGMGVVEAAAPDAGALQVGQRVIPVHTSGTWQEFLVTKAPHLIAPPDGISDESAAQFLVNPLSAWIMLTEELAMQPGQWLLQTAAGSTLSRVVLQVARLRNVRTINVVRRREQREELKALGADEVICTEDEDLGQRVMSITDGAGVPAAIDAVGSETGSDAVRVLAPGGSMLTYGMLSFTPIEIHGGQMVFRTTSVRGFWLAPWLQRVSAEKRRAVFADVLTSMAKGEIVPPVEAKYDLGEVLEAVRHAERPGRRGKVLLVS